MTDKQHSPAAQAVLKAVQATMPDYMMTDSTAGCFAAAALRAAANDWRIDTEFICGVEYIRTSTLDAIAAELEGK
jgi:hypothetical protein